VARQLIGDGYAWIDYTTDVGTDDSPGVSRIHNQASH
jgi:hypothetical protein